MATPQIQIDRSPHEKVADRTGAPKQAILDLRQAVLEELHGLDYRPLARIPHAWPILRSFVVGTVRSLMDDGLVESTILPGRGGGQVGYRMTAAGRRTLQRLRSATRRV